MFDSQEGKNQCHNSKGETIPNLEAQFVSGTQSMLPSGTKESHLGLEVKADSRALWESTGSLRL